MKKGPYLGDDLLTSPADGDAAGALVAFAPPDIIISCVRCTQACSAAAVTKTSSAGQLAPLLSLKNQ